MRAGHLISSLVLTWHFVLFGFFEALIFVVVLLLFVRKSIWVLQKFAKNEQLLMDAKKYLTDIKWEQPMYWCIFINIRFDFLENRFFKRLKKFFIVFVIELKLMPFTPPFSFKSFSLRWWSSYWVALPSPSSYKITSLSLKLVFRVEPTSQEFKLENK